MKLTTDILPRALWNFCEEIFRIENTRFILLKTLKFLMAFAIERKTTTKRMRCQILKVGFSRCEKALWTPSDRPYGVERPPLSGLWSLSFKTKLIFHSLFFLKAKIFRVSLKCLATLPKFYEDFILVISEVICQMSSINFHLATLS